VNTVSVDKAASQARGERAHVLTTMTLVVAGGGPGPELRRSVQEFQRATFPGRTEIVVATETPWYDPPEGVRVVVTGAVSRGEKLDRASEGASGDLLAFVDASVRLSPTWQVRAFEVLSDPAIAAAGGPQLPPSTATTDEQASWLVLSSPLGSGPYGYRYRRQSSRGVPEMATCNLIVRRQAFQAIGGFQSPTPLGDDARLCYKLRSIIGLSIVCDPALAVEIAPSPLLKPFLSVMRVWGRHRGDMSRRLPEASRRWPNALPAVALLSELLLAVSAPFSWRARAALGLIVFVYLLAAAQLVARGPRWRAALLAGVSLPLVHLAYGVGFWQGFLGRSLGEVFPGRLRQHQPLRILIFNWRDITHPWAGGAESYMHELARRWVRQGCEVGWISERYRTGKRVETIDGIRFHRLGGHFTLYPLAALAYLWRLRNSYDIIVDCENGIPFFTPLYIRKPVVLVVHHLHQEVFRRELPAYLRWLALWLEGWLMPHVYRRKTVVTVSPSTLSDLQAHGYDPERMMIVTNGVEVPNIAVQIERNGIPLLLYLGRLKRYKSIDVLLRAMPQVLSDFPNAKLAVVGQGPEREPLERLSWRLGLAEHVRFYGYVDKLSRDKLLAAAWLAVCPSRFEGWGMVCLEANAWGTPVVAARVPGLRDAVLDGVTGRLVPYGNSTRLADEVVALLADRQAREAMGQAGRAWAAEHSWERSARIFLNQIMKVAGLLPISEAPGPSEVREPAAAR